MPSENVFIIRIIHTNTHVQRWRGTGVGVWGGGGFSVIIAVRGQESVCAAVIL